MPQVVSAKALHHVEAMAPSDGKPGVPVALDEFGQPLPFDAVAFAKAASTVVKTSNDLLKFSEQVSGVDVVKAITIRTQSDKDGKLVTWDGIDSLAEAVDVGMVKDHEPKPLKALPPAKSADDESDLW